MDNPEPQKQLCTIRVVFPVETDEDAISYKQKITSVLAQVPDAQITFGLMNTPSAPQCKA